MAYADGDPDIHILNNLNNVGAIEVNAFQSQADVVIQKSTREGFGLTVSEALWKARPFIGGDVGGIPLQVQDGETGYLVTSPEECADRCAAHPARARPRQAARPLRQGARAPALPHAAAAARLAAYLPRAMTQETPLVLVSNRGPATFERERTASCAASAAAAASSPRSRAWSTTATRVWVASAMTDEDVEVSREHGGGSFECELDDVSYRIRLVESDPDAYDALLQRRREPDAVVHPALPLGPLERAGHPPARGRRLREGLLPW